MARPRKEGMDYFPHDVNLSSDKKVEALRIIHGNDGYAFYCIMLELIYQEKNFELDISDAETIQILAKKVEVTPQKLEEMIKTSIKHGCFDRESYEKRQVLTSNGIKKRASVVVEKREKMRQAYNSPKPKVSSLVSDAEMGEESTQSKSKSKSKSKVKDKVKESISGSITHTPERDHLLNLMNEHSVKTTLFGLDQIYSYIGVVETEVIETAIKKAAGKHINYAINTLQGWISEGKTKLEQILPKPSPGTYKGQSSGKPQIEVIQPSTVQTISDEEYANLIRLAEEMGARKHGKKEEREPA